MRIPNTVSTSGPGTNGGPSGPAHPVISNIALERLTRIRIVAAPQFWGGGGGGPIPGGGGGGAIPSGGGGGGAMPSGGGGGPPKSGGGGGASVATPQGAGAAALFLRRGVGGG